jgi:hypothetical protein
MLLPMGYDKMFQLEVNVTMCVYGTNNAPKLVKKDQTCISLTFNISRAKFMIIVYLHLVSISLHMWGVCAFR